MIERKKGNNLFVLENEEKEDLLEESSSLLSQRDSNQISYLTCGWNHSFVIRSGLVFCWGKNDSGQLGIGTDINESYPTIIEYFKSKTLSLIAGGGSHSFAVEQSTFFFLS